METKSRKMGRLGNMFQIKKKQDKTSEKELHIAVKSLMILRMLAGLNEKTLRTSTKNWEIQRTRVKEYNK